jgi:hypothetical protein
VSAEQVTKYEAWIRELEARQRTLAASRSGYLGFFAAMLVVSTLGFAWNAWVGAATLVTGILFCAFGLYVVLARDGQYTREIEATRRTVTALRRDGARP